MKDIDDRILKIERIIEQLDEVYMSLCIDEAKGFEKFNIVVSDLSEQIGEIVSKASDISQMGVDIPVEVIVSQLNNITEACTNLDSIMLADTVRYEIRETLVFYKEILQEMKKENLSFEEN